MSRKNSRLTACLLLSGLGLAACSSGADIGQYGLPQQERIYRGDLTAQERQALAAAHPQTEAELEREAQWRARHEAKTVQLTTLGQPRQEPVVAFGFVGDGTDAYVVFRDGAAWLFSSQGPAQELERLAPRLDGAFLAGPDRDLIVGNAPRGTLTVWSTENDGQQLILRPQNATFNQDWALDTAPIEGERMIAVAAERRRLELWSLLSGRMVRSTTFDENIQPAAVMPNSQEQAVVFGTLRGEILEWNGNSNPKFLYAHKGQVIAIRSVGQQYIASVGRDGKLFVYDRNADEVVLEEGFPRSVYQLYVGPNERFVVAVPAIGEPVAVDLESLEVRPLSTSRETRLSDGGFARSGDLFLARSLDGDLIIWDLETAEPIGALRPIDSPAARQQIDVFAERVDEPGPWGSGFNQGDANRDVVDYAVNEAEGILAVASDFEVSYFSLDTLQPIRVALVSDKQIAGVAVSPVGQKLLVGYSDGEFLSMLIWTDGLHPIEPGRL